MLRYTVIALPILPREDLHYNDVRKQIREREVSEYYNDKH